MRKSGFEFTKEFFNPSAVPEELKGRKQWLLWRRETVNGRSTKVPYNPNAEQYDENKRASSTDPATWGTFAAVMKMLKQYPCQFSGVGYVPIAGEGLVGIDCDNVKDTPNWSTMLKIPTYAEISPSGSGLRILGLGQLPFSGRKKGWLELYRSDRFLTITGNVVDAHSELRNIQTYVDRIVSQHFVEAAPANNAKNPSASIEDEELVRLALSHDKNGKFEALWNCSTGNLEDFLKDDGNDVDHSRCHMALAVKLAFYSRDVEQLKRLILASGFGDDAKLSRAGYLENLISKALDYQREAYTPPKVTVDDSAVESTIGGWDCVIEAPATSGDKLERLGIIKWSRLKEIAANQKDKWIVGGLVEPATSVVISGLPYAGKTRILAQLMGCVASGRDFIGFEIKERCPILFLNCDRLRERHIVRRISTAFLDPLDEAQFEELFFTLDVPKIPTTITVDFLHELTGVIKDATKAIGSSTGLLICDPLRAAFMQEMEAGSENDPTVMTQVLNPIRGLARETGWTAITPHHNSRGRDMYAGSAAIAGCTDGLWNVQREEGSNIAKLHVLDRDGDRNFNIIENEHGLSRIDEKAKRDAEAVKVEAALVEKINKFPINAADAWTIQEIIDHGIVNSRAECQRFLDEAGAPGRYPRINELGAGRRGDPLRYFRA
jgi:hypothetical protein